MNRSTEIIAPNIFFFPTPFTNNKFSESIPIMFNTGSGHQRASDTNEVEPSGGIPVYHENDVLCGRGGKAYKNLG